MQIATPFGTNEGRYKFLGRPQLVNCYAELLGGQQKARYGIIPSDGTIEYDEVTDSPCRGMIYLEDVDVVYSVHSQGLFKVTSTPTVTYIGVVPGTDRVQIERNQKEPFPQITIYTAAGVFIVENDNITKLTVTDLPTITGLSYLGGYNIYGIADGRFFISGLNEATTVDGLDFAEAEQYADKLIKPFSDRGELILFGQISTEFWRLTGNDDFPFEPITGTTLKKGLLAPNAVSALDNSVFWPGNDNIVYRLNGYGAVRVSENWIERLIEDDPSPSAIFSHTWTRSGHVFYSLTGTNWAVVYDVSTQQWHQRESYGETRWRASSTVSAWNKVIFGDLLSGSLFYLSRDTYTEAGNVMTYKVRAPTMHAFPNGGICDALHIDTLTGDGALLPTAQGYDPIMMLSWSDDGGVTFRGNRELDLGRRGKTGTRVTTRRTGRFGPKGRIWKMEITDPVGRGLALLDAEVRPLKR